MIRFQEGFRCKFKAKRSEVFMLKGAEQCGKHIVFLSGVLCLFVPRRTFLSDLKKNLKESFGN